MAGLYRFLASYEALIYIVLAIGALFSIRWLWNSWREWRQALYKLEREFSLRRMSQALTISLVIFILFCAEFSMASFVIPGLPAEVFLSTPTLDLLATPAGTLSPEDMTRVASAPPGGSQANALGCVPDQLTITSPEPAEEISGTVDIQGTVNLPNFGFYKYEVAPQGSDTWVTISAGRVVKIRDSLGLWDTTALTPGDYQLRVVVTDNEGLSLPPCIIPVRVMAP
jgi:hypothetical protein